MEFLIADNYLRLLVLHGVLLLAFLLVVLAGELWHLTWGQRFGLLGLFLLSYFVVFDRDMQPSVYYDEFFYTAIAQNMASYGRSEPLLWSGNPPSPVHLGYFLPPYPQGWPFIASWFMPPALAPGPGVVEVPAWPRLVLAGRWLQVFMPCLAFLGLLPRFSGKVSGVCSIMLLSLPLLFRLGQGGSAENAALFFVLLAFWAYEVFRRRGDGPSLAFLVLSLAGLAEMRPECLLVAGGLALLSMPRLSTSQMAKPWYWMCLLLGMVFLAPPLVVMLGHNPSLDHHFQAIPRGDYGMWENRGLNVVNNAWFFLCDKIWPVGLTILAALGCRRGWQACRAAKLAQTSTSQVPSAAGNALANPAPGKLAWLLGKLAWLQTEASFWLVSVVWIKGISLALSWFPFGDYNAANSVDTWRFSYHIVVPMLVLAAGGLAWLEQKGRWGKIVGFVLAVWVIIDGQYPGVFLNQRHCQAFFSQFSQVVKANLGNRYVLAEAPEYFCYLHYYQGLPALLSDPKWPGRGSSKAKTEYLLFTVDEGKGLFEPERWADFDYEVLDYSPDGVPSLGLYLVGPKGGAVGD